jgi:hypothetical protein
MLARVLGWLLKPLGDFLLGVREVRYPDGVWGRGPFYQHGWDKHGFWTFYYENGQTWCQGEFEMGFESGSWTFFHPNGKACARGVDGWRRQGTWEFWDEAGCPLDEASFLSRYPAIASRLPKRHDEPEAAESSRADQSVAADLPRE